MLKAFCCTVRLCIRSRTVVFIKCQKDGWFRFLIQSLNRFLWVFLCCWCYVEGDVCLVDKCNTCIMDNNEKKLNWCSWWGIFSLVFFKGFTKKIENFLIFLPYWVYNVKSIPICLAIINAWPDDKGHILIYQRLIDSIGFYFSLSLSCYGLRWQQIEVESL